MTGLAGSHLGRGKLDLRRPCWLLRRLWEKDRTTGLDCTPPGTEPPACPRGRGATCSDRTKICTSPETLLASVDLFPTSILVGDCIDCYYRGHTRSHHLPGGPLTDKVRLDSRLESQLSSPEYKTLSSHHRPDYQLTIESESLVLLTTSVCAVA